MSKIPAVLRTRSTMNHVFCLSWAAFHSAKPFQKIDQREIAAKIIPNIGLRLSGKVPRVLLNICSIICSSRTSVFYCL